ncbi:MAG: hypothetical protein IK105_02270 [Thermoguttaceae bacterium]|nr:hypothetical protein [Thermoguttaceae bacterium]
MKEIRNFKGEVVQTKSSSGYRCLRWSGEVWGMLFGLLFVALGCLVPPRFMTAFLRLFDVRFWSWPHFLVFTAVICYAVGCWHIYRNWEDYDGDEECRAKSFIAFGLTVMVILLLLVILYLSGRFFLFFRPLVTMFSTGRFSLAGVGRLALIVVSLIPLIHFGKGWILGFFEE